MVTNTQKKTKSKYNNKKCEIVKEDGTIQKFDSIKEKDRYLQLCLMEDAGEIEKGTIECQKKFVLIPKQRYQGKAIRECAYFADFAYTRKDGTKVVEDVKGYSTYKKGFSTETPEFKIKRKLFILNFGNEYEFNII